MNLTTLIVRNLRFHFRGNLAVLLGAAVGSAVLTGALLVGDSLRGSLRDRSDRQLGGIDNVLIGPRFLRENLVAELPGTVRGALLLQGAVHSGSPEGSARVGKVSVWGVNSHFGIDRPELDTDEPIAILSTDLAKKLQVKENDTIYVGVQKASTMPRASFLSKRGISDATRSFRLTVKAVLPPQNPANALNLSIAPTLPLNMFIPLARLQREIEQPGRINALLGTGQSAQSLQSELFAHLTLDDWNLKVYPDFGADRKAKDRLPPRKSYISVESTRLILEPAVASAVFSTAEKMNLLAAGTYTYLANTIDYRNMEIPYSIVAALNPSAPPPLGPFLPAGVDHLDPGDIVLVDWGDSPIKIDPEDKDPRIKLTYYKPEVEAKIEEASHEFRFRGFIKLAGPADDRYLTPDFPGITDKANLRSWNPPFEIKQDKIKQRDDRFWDKYRTTPKAYVRLDDGQKLWGTRFGNLTSIRLAPKDGADLETIRNEFADRLRATLDGANRSQSGVPKDAPPADLAFQPIRERMLAAAGGSTDFGMLFLMFSFFLIVAALMLVGLLFRLNLERRAAEIGLLRASGFPLSTVRRLLLSEGLLVAAFGSALGLAGAFAYADALIRLLVALWPTPGVETYLSFHVTTLSLGIGFVSAVLMSGLTILWALRSLSKLAPAQLLKGDTTPTDPSANRYRPSPWPTRIAVVAFVCAAILAVMGPFMPAGEPQAGTFFGSGSLLLTTGLTLLWIWLKRQRRSLVSGHGAVALAKLGSRNAVRNPVRSLLTAGLLAAAAFLLVAVESFRREPNKDFAEKTGGSGGFPLLAETATPIDFDLNDSDGREQIEDGLMRSYQDQGMAADQRDKQLQQDLAVLKDVAVYRFRVQAGDDASCLNLYQASRPRLLGVPNSLISRGGFSFAASLSDSSNPWAQLSAGVKGPQSGTPCLVEQNTAMWMLKKGLGERFDIMDENNQPLTLEIVGFLKDSVFQSQVLIPEGVFHQHFPKTEGFSYFLIDAPVGKEKDVSRVLSAALANYGFETTPTRERVAEYLAVQNTYLTTFQLLGGFGLLLGVLGLSVVLLRSIWERRAELALMRAIGYRKRSLNGIILAENALLLVLGLGVGLFAALAAIAPHLASGGQIPGTRLAVMLGLVFVVGLAVAFVAVTTTLRAPLIPALREE